MINFNIESAKQTLNTVKDIFNTLKKPLGNEKSKNIITAIDNATSKLAVGLTNENIQKLLQELDLEIDGVAGNNITSDFSKFNFVEQFKTQITSKLPSVSANLNLSWSLNSNQGSAILGDLKLGSLLGQNSFIGEVLSDVESALKPVDRIIDGLTEDISFLTKGIPDGLGISKSELDLNKDKSVSVLDLLQYANNIAPENLKIDGLNEFSIFIDEVKQILTITDKVKAAATAGISVPGSLIFDIQKKQFIGNINSLGRLPDELQSELDKISNFKLPILNTETAFDLFFGNKPEIELFEYRMPTVSLSTPEAFAKGIKVPIVIPALKATFGPTIGGSIDLGFGYDTTGFYIKDSNGTKPELKFFGEFRVGLELGDANFGAELNGGGNIGLEANLFINSDAQKKARTLSFTTAGSAYAYLDASASINALGPALGFLNAQLQVGGAATDYLRDITKDAGILGDTFKIIDKGFDKFNDFFQEKKTKAPSAVLFELESPRLSLWEFGGSNSSVGEPKKPILATLSGDVLFINIGTRAKERKVGDIIDGSETFSVRETGTQL